MLELTTRKKTKINVGKLDSDHTTSSEEEDKIDNGISPNMSLAKESERQPLFYPLPKTSGSLSNPARVISYNTL